MLKETETEETICFVVIIFAIGGISNGKRGPYACVTVLIKHRSFLVFEKFAKFAFYNVTKLQNAVFPMVRSQTD